MAFFDLPLSQLNQYHPERSEPADFDAFWSATLAEARRYPTVLTLTPVDFGWTLIDAYDVTFNGYGGQQIKGWLTIPHERTGKVPCIVQLHGYSCGRDMVPTFLQWPAAGYAHFTMDNRGQGGECLPSATPDPDLESTHPAVRGWMTSGVLNPQTYYYRRLFTDAVRFVDAIRTYSEIDPNRVTVAGGSQAGGMAIAVSALSDGIVASLVDVPLLCHFRRAVEITDAHPYQELVIFCKTHRDKNETVFNTLDYFDGVNFAARAKQPTLFSVGLMDDVCPPSTVFAAYNYWAGQKSINVYPFNKHEGGGNVQDVEKNKFLRAHFS